MEERDRERWYEAPRMELVEVAVEHGFAVSDVTVGGGATAAASEVVRRRM